MLKERAAGTCLSATMICGTLPKLAEQQAVVSDVAIDAKSLLARADEPASPGQPAAAVDNPAT